jgi:hypothetical protein
MATTGAPPAPVCIREDGVLLREGIASSGSALDAEVVRRMLGRLTPREHQVLATAQANTGHRRVRVVLMFVRGQRSGP